MLGDHCDHGVKQIQGRSLSVLYGGSTLKATVMHQGQIRGDTGWNASGRGFLDYTQCTGWILGHFTQDTHPSKSPFLLLYLKTVSFGIKPLDTPDLVMCDISPPSPLSSRITAGYQHKAILQQKNWLTNVKNVSHPYLKFWAGYLYLQTKRTYIYRQKEWNHDM